MNIVDAHHHLWDLEACQYPWLMARGVRRFFGDPSPIQKNYLVDNLLEDAASWHLDASVHVQVGVAPGDELKESEWLQAVGDVAGLPSAIVAYCALEQPGAVASLERQLTVPRVRGIRQIVGRADDEDARSGTGRLPGMPAWRKNLALLGELGLSFDLQMTPRQVTDVVDALAAAPATQVALCHCGSPWDQSSAGLADWRTGMRLLASLAQVHCKISGLGMFDNDWTVDSIRPIVENCIDIFGAERCMFGSNFPVDKLYGSYDRVWHAYLEITAPLSDADRALLFGDVARKFYRID